MVAVSNPRFPHWCRITRKRVSDPLVDEDDFVPVTDFDPMDSDAGEENNEDTPAEEESGAVCETTVIYEGKCRGYEKNTTSDRGEVITSYRGLALPLTQDEWTELGMAPQEGDELVVDKGAFKEYGRVIDVNPANFHGTHLTWRYGRN